LQRLCTYKSGDDTELTKGWSELQNASLGLSVRQRHADQA
jgi:hypothetical protein